MMAILGFLSLILALGCAAGGLVALLAGRRLRHDPARAAWGRVAAAGLFAGVTLAVVMMEAALIGFDFSIRYVAATRNSNGVARWRARFCYGHGSWLP